VSIDHTKQQINEDFPELSTLGKIHSRIDKVKLIIQDKDVDFFNKHCHLFERLEGSGRSLLIRLT